MLTREEVAQYQETGQVTPKFRLGDEVVRAIKEKMEAHFAARPELEVNGSPRYAPPATTQFTDCLIESDRTWLDYAIDPDILDAVSQLLGNDIIVWASNIFCKEGMGDKATPWHQDGLYWPMRPLRACSVWIAIDHSTPENGCLRIVPGSHNEQRVLRHGAGNSGQRVLWPSDQTIQAADMPDVDPVDVVLEPGMVSLHDVFTIHGSAPNSSGERRAGLVYRYMPASSHYDRNLGAKSGGPYPEGSHMSPERSAVSELHLVRGVDVCGLNSVWHPNA